MLNRFFRNVGVTAACLVAAVGGVVLAAVSPGALVGLIAVASIVGLIVVTLLLGADAPGERPLPSRIQRRHAAVVGVATAVGIASALLVLAGGIAILGAAAAPVLLLLILGAGGGLWRHRTAWRAYATAVAHTATRPQPAAAPRPSAVAGHVVPGALTVRALCLAWQRTHWSLPDLPAGPARSELLSTRAQLLDELEERDPVGFRRWLHRGVHASSDPGHYLTENRTGSTP